MISAMNILRTGDFNSFCYEREKKQEKYTGLTPQHTAILLKIVYPSFVLMQSFVFKLETFEEQQGNEFPSHESTFQS